MSARRKIAIVDWLFRWPPDGGARVEVAHILEYLSAQAETRLICPKVAGDPANRGVLDGLPETLRRQIRTVNATQQDFLSGKLLRDVVAEVDQFAPDRVLIGDAWHYKPFLIAALARYRPAVRFFAHEGICLKGHGHRFADERPCDYCYLDKGASFDRCLACARDWKAKTRTHVFDLGWAAAGLPDAKDYEATMRSALAAAGLVMTCNRREQERLAPYCRKVIVSRCGVNAEWLSNPRTGPFPGAADGTWRFLMPGRCDDYLKGLHILVAAGVALRGRGVLNFEVAYTGAPRECWRDLAWLKPLGWLPRERVAPELTGSDLTVHPAVWPEPFGISALESITKGVPAVVAGHGGLVDIADVTGGGWKFKPGDPIDLADTLERIMKNPELPRTASKKGIAQAEQWLWDKVLRESCSEDELLGPL